MTNELAVVADGLTKRYGDHLVVDQLSFELPTGGVTGFLGPNGSGKSTTIRMLLGLVRPSAGGGTVLGSRLTRPAAYLDRVGALVDSPALYPQLSGFDNLRVHTELAGLPKCRVDEVLAIVGLDGRGGDRAGSYSLGMRQRLAIAIALLRDPPLLILDEPTNGLDPAGIVEIRNLIRTLGAEGRTVLVSSHVLAEMQAACDRYVVIRDGKLLFAGTADGLLATSPRRVITRTSDPKDLDALQRLYLDDGRDVQRIGDELHISGPAADPAELNQLAFAAGFTLSGLTARHDDLEDVFLNLTSPPTLTTDRVEVLR